MTLEAYTAAADHIASQYAKAFNTMDVSHIAPLLHRNFKFLYPTKVSRGGITTNIRYPGQLYLTFMRMKEAGHTISAATCHMLVGGVPMAGLILQPPHNRDLIFPSMDETFIEEVQLALPETEVYIFIRIKQGLLFKAECCFGSRTWQNGSLEILDRKNT